MAVLCRSCVFTVACSHTGCKKHGRLCAVVQHNDIPVFVGTVGRISSVLPFSLCEILLYAVIILAAIGVVFTVIRFVKGKGKRKKLLMRVLAVVVCFAVSVFMVFTLFCGINYNRFTFSKVSGFTVETYTAQELADLCVYILKNANDAAGK